MTTRPAIVVDDRLPDIEYEPPEKAEQVTDKDYKPVPGAEDTEQ